MKTIGDRITYCRSTIGFTRKELAEYWGGASIPTISRWELDVIEPHEKKIKSVSEFFCSKGLVVSCDWILNGVGAPPALLNMEEFKEDHFDEMCEQNFLDLATKIKDFTFYKVTSNFFSPIIRYGDYVGGVQLNDNLIDCVGSLVFVVHGNIVYLGFLVINDDKVAIKNSQGKLMELPDYDLLAKIYWSAIRP